MNTSPKAGVHSLLPPDPRLRGTSSWGYGCAFPAGLRQDPLSFLPRGHRPLPGQKLRTICAVQTPPTLAEPWQLVRPATAAPNRKAGTRRCHLEVQCQQIWMEVGPSGPRVGGEQILILPAGNHCRAKAACEHPLREGAHRRRSPAAFCLLCRRGQSRTPLRAELSK